ncbi:MAG: class I SAM-dependent methyltransferase, partial [Coxiellaceae bacterium]|nr:class I SAM-dependent methyltransferase [Coxiellaceae bacterium]
MMNFKDYFSKQSADYKRYRPQYPRELFEYIATQCTERHVALDCATGNGQAAIALAEFFDRVIGIDGSSAQLSHAHQHERVEYRQASAENTGLADHSVDCVTVAQAFHWFDFDAFFEEVKRVVVPGGIVALWCYPIIHAMDKQVDHQLQSFYHDTIGPYWPPERRFIDERYQTFHLPFDEIESPLFSQEKHWSVEDLSGYLSTWSSVQKYKDQH